MTIRFAIEDNDHCQDISTHADLAKAIDALHALAGFYPVSTDCWVKSLKARSLAWSLRWMSGLWNRSM